MIKFIKKFSGIKDSNLVFLAFKQEELSLLKDLKLEKKVLDRIKKAIDKKENIVLDFFIGTENFEKLFFIFFNDKKGKDINYFLGDEFRKLPSNLTILPNSLKNIEILLNNSILARYKYEEYKTEKKPDKINFIVSKDGEKIAKERLKTIENIILARDLTTMPANDLFPESFAELVKKTKFKKTKVKIFNSKDLKKYGLNLILEVGKGSNKKSQMVILEKIIDKKLPTIGLIGKGITYDTGGIQVKPENYMYEMKGDMAGAAAVFALMKELDEKELKVNIIASLVLAENHISGESYKPSDIVKSYSGKTVDVAHTDAEGRLILADGISYLSDKYKLDKIITLATLTGACMHALGFRYAGIMGNDEEFISKVLNYSKDNFEKYCRLPFDDYFIEKTKGEVADLENINRKIYAGSTMGGAFLYNFVLNNEKFTHIDIAGTAINSYEPFGYANSGMTGFGVDSLSKVIEDL